MWQHIKDLHWPWEASSANFIPSHLLVWAVQPFRCKYPSNTALILVPESLWEAKRESFGLLRDVSH